MTVHFTTTPAIGYDPALRSVMKSARGTAGSKVCAILVRGLGLDVPAIDLRRWVLHNGRDTFADGVKAADGMREEFDVEGAQLVEAQRNTPGSLAALVAGGRAWREVLNAASDRNLSSTSLSGDALRDVRLNYARCMYAALLVPLPALDVVKISGRANLLSVVAFLSKMLIEHETGWDRAPIAQGWLGATLGWDKVTAGRHLQRLVAMHLLTNPAGGQRVIGKYSLRQVSAARLAKVVCHEESIVAFVDETYDALAALIRSVDHPAWSYSGVLTHQHRLVLIADAAEIPVRTLGVTVKRERELRAVLESVKASEYLSVETAHKYLPEILDSIANKLAFGLSDPVTGELLTPMTCSKGVWAEWRMRSEEWKLQAEEISTRNRRPEASPSAPMVAVTTAGADWYTETDEIAVQINQVLDQWDELFPLPHNPMEGDPGDADTREEQFATWIVGLQREVTTENPAEVFRARGGEALVSRMMGRAYPEKLARGAVAFVMRAPLGTDYGHYLIGDIPG